MPYMVKQPEEDSKNFVSVQPKPAAAPAPAAAGADAKMEDATPAEAPVDAQQEAEDAAAGEFPALAHLTCKNFYHMSSRYFCTAPCAQGCLWKRYDPPHLPSP